MGNKDIDDKFLEVWDEGGFEIKMTFDANGDPSLEISGIKGKTCTHIVDKFNNLLGGIDDVSVPTQEFFQVPEPPSQIKEKEKSSQPPTLNRPVITGFEGSGGAPGGGPPGSAQKGTAKNKQKENRRRKR